MGMINRYDVCVLHILTEKHLLTIVTARVSLLARHKELLFLNRIVTGDKNGSLTTMWYEKEAGYCQLNPVKL